MISFECDYVTGAHPQILKRLAETNFEFLSGYGVDKYCESAKEKIKKTCGCADAEVELLVGGTQTNAIVIASLLKDYEGVIAATTGHVSVHESGAIEYTGHKVLTLPQENGKIKADDLQHYIENFYADGSHEHMVFPGMVYVSYPTECGTLYTKTELTRISEVTRKYSIPLYLDGARLGYGLMSRESDLTLNDIAQICDVFYIGGTKVGALCGEAVVFTKKNKPAHFMNSVKKRGALLAKGRLLGVQFDTLFTDNLYFDISKNAIDCAEKLKQIFSERGYKFCPESPTNQQFIVIADDKLKKLNESVGSEVWSRYDDTHTVVRFATAWSTTESDLDTLKNALDKL